MFRLYIIKGGTWTPLMPLCGLSGLCVFISALLSCMAPVFSLIYCLTVRWHICPLCKKKIGFGNCECCRDGEGVRTPDHLADMA